MTCPLNTTAPLHLLECLVYLVASLPHKPILTISIGVFSAKLAIRDFGTTFAMQELRQQRH
jgi:hypothetical protein